MSPCIILMMTFGGGCFNFRHHDRVYCKAQQGELK